MRKMTNSAGLTGAMPISTISCPASTTSGGLISVVALDEEGVLGRGAEQRAVAPHAGQERVDVALDRSHRSRSFGSKTTHWVPSSMDFSTKLKSRRTFR